MLNDRSKAALTDALSALRNGDAGAWNALVPLTRVAAEGTDAAIDFTTESTLGAALIVLRQRAAPSLPLTPRQSEVAALVARGLTNKAIARTLGLSPATVKDHVHAILTATGVSGRAGLIALMHGAKPATGDP